MNKNIILGGLVLVILIGLGFYFSKEKEIVTPGDNNTNITVTPNVPDTVVLVANAPVVQTGTEAGTSSSTATVTGSVKPNGAATTYWFEYGATTSLGSKTSSQSVGSGFSSIPTTGFITGLRANSLYYYRLSAQNKLGKVDGQTLSLQTNNNTPPKVAAPTARTNAATSIEKNTAIINGQINPNGYPTSYWFEYGKDDNFGYVTSYQATNSGSSFMSVPTSISGLEPLTKYYFRLNGQNQFGTVNGTTMSFTTTGPAAASEPKVSTSPAKSVSSSDAIFVGQVNPNNAETTYWFEYSNDSLLNNLIGSGTPQRTLASSNTNQEVQINVNGLSANTKYYYHLVAKNKYGTVSGNIVSFTTRK